MLRRAGGPAGDAVPAADRRAAADADLDAVHVPFGVLTIHDGIRLLAANPVVFHGDVQEPRS